MAITETIYQTGSYCPADGNLLANCYLADGDSMITALPEFKSQLTGTKPDEEMEPPTKLLHPSNISAILTLALNVLLAVFLIVIVFTEISLTNAGSLTATNKVVYLTGTTVLASACTFVTSTQIRTLWLRIVDARLYSGVSIARADPLWRTILGIGTAMEILQYWHTSVAFIGCGLTTTAVVAGLTSSPNTYMISQNYALADPNPYDCMAISNNASGSSAWQLSNGYFLTVYPDVFSCPTRETLSLIGTINIFNASAYGYADQGVAVERSALGSPASIYTSETTPDGSSVTLWLEETLQTYQSSLLSTTQCVPVLTANPIQCTKQSNVTFSDGYLSMTTSDGCSVSINAGVSAGTATDGWTAATMCLHNQVGEATILLGSLNYDALYLAESIGDTDWLERVNPNALREPLLYGTVCTVNTAPVVETQTITLTMGDISETANSFSRSLLGDSRSCTPVALANETFQDPVNDKLRAIAALGPWQPLATGLLQYVGQLESSGRLAHASNATAFIRRPPYAFSNSRNALEDVLGLTSALALSRITVTGSTGAIDYVGSATIANTRVGTGPALELLGQLTYQFTLIQPYIPTYVHLIISALFPIYAGSHASLSRPSSAVKPPRRKKRATKDHADQDDDDEEEEGEVAEMSQRMEGLSPSDAILYPVLTGCMLAGLYFVIKWLKDPAILNKILNWYLSVFGVLSITKLLSDSMTIAISYVFPTRYYDGGSIWNVEGKQRLALARHSDLGGDNVLKPRMSPLPGLASRIPLSNDITRVLWNVRDYLTQPLFIIEAYISSVLQRTKTPVGPQGQTSFLIAVIAVLYFNLVDKPWWLTNLLGFSFSYSALQLMSPTTFWTGTLVLTSLFFYDIYFVFFTPLMITVATKLDIPVKLLFPRPAGVNDDPNKKSLAMLGLGDVVLPGIMIGLALRFDLYLFYLKKQRRQKVSMKDGSTDGSTDGSNAPPDEIEHDGMLNLQQSVTKTDRKADPTEEVVKAIYRSATGGWGERYWLGSKAILEGSSFPKTYFHASVVGYIMGMICTLGVMHVYHHGQPALLYLVPGVLCSLWGTALFRGEIKTMWAYTEAQEEEKKKKKMPETSSRPKGVSVSHARNDKDAKVAETSGSEKDEPPAPKGRGVVDPHEEVQSASTQSRRALKTAVARHFIFFAISLPTPSASKSQTTTTSKNIKSLKGGSNSASTNKSTGIDTPRTSSSSVNSTLVRRSSDASDAEPAEKRPRLG
ncbi:hypothetical protein MMC18_009308 [Xylographa bjoerkii]|nr:hypothetical protein [Xylographa bjoerkii]